MERAIESIDEALAEARTWPSDAPGQLLISMKILDDAGANARVLSDHLRALGFLYDGLEQRPGARLYKYRPGVAEPSKHVASLELTLDDVRAMRDDAPYSPLPDVLMVILALYLIVELTPLLGPPHVGWQTFLGLGMFAYLGWDNLPRFRAAESYFARRTPHQHQRYSFDEDGMVVRSELGRSQFAWTDVRGWTLTENLLWLKAPGHYGPLHMRAFTPEQRRLILGVLPARAEGLAETEFNFLYR